MMNRHDLPSAIPASAENPGSEQPTEPRPPSGLRATSNNPAPAAHCAECLRAEAESWGRTWVEVDLAAFGRNVGRVAARLGPGGRLIVSAKKDAYGHGLLEVVRAAAEMPVVGAVGVATVEEGLVLRRAGIALPVIIFSVLEGDALAAAIAQELTLSVTGLEDAAAADRLAARVGRPARAHLKLDTGMGRLGRLGAEVAGEVARMRALPHLRLEAVYSHLADGWADPASAREQCRQMENFRQTAELTSLPCHWGGSDALSLGEPAVDGRTDPLSSSSQRGAWLRSGIALYGDHPALPELEPVMTFKSRVVYRRRVPAGTAISYGTTFRTTRETELALIGAGYGNGYLRGLSGRGACVLLSGRRYPLLGRICMDQFAVDVTDAPEVRVGEEAVLFGRQGEAVLPAGEVAALAGTISYELFCLAGQLNPRRYLAAR